MSLYVARAMALYFCLSTQSDLENQRCWSALVGGLRAKTESIDGCIEVRASDSEIKVFRLIHWRGQHLRRQNDTWLLWWSWWWKWQGTIVRCGQDVLWWRLLENITQRKIQHWVTEKDTLYKRPTWLRKVTKRRALVVALISY